MPAATGGSGAPLRIALNHTRLADSGGVEAYIFRLVHALLLRGHAIDYFCARVERPIEHPAFRVFPVPQPRRPTSLRVALFARRSARAIARAEREAPYDVVQGFGRTWYQTVYRDGSGCHADYREAYLDRVKRRGWRRTHYRLFPTDGAVQAIERWRYVARPPRLVIAISRLVRDQILRRHPLAPERVRVLYNGIDLERHHPRLADAGRAQLLPALFGPDLRGEGDAAPRALVFVGSDFGRKGLDLLIDALAELEGEPSLAKRRYAVAVVGRDHREAQWQQRAARRGVGGRLRFLGYRDDVPALLAGSDGLVLPSWFDAFGNVVAEALACGAPVVASASCGGAEWIRDGENGFVATRQEPACLARALRALLLRDDAGSLREMARRTALAYPWDAHVDALLALYREAASNRSSGAT
jgi:UDP-glucose:(heptosyl)LPS alpha-1,3-glucosyltransferase